MLLPKLADADAGAAETLVWLDFASRCSYLASDVHQTLTTHYEELGKMIGSMMKHLDRFAPA